MLLLPIGLKFEHVLDHHKEFNECTNSAKHFHSSVDHSDFLDVYFLPHLNFRITYFNSFEYIDIVAPIVGFNNEFFQSYLNKLGVRGPPY